MGSAESKVKWTPGPWFAARPEHCRGWWIVSTDKEGWHSVDDSGDGGFHEHNARLIAAAPDMYEALEAAQESIATFMGVHGYTMDSGAGDVLCQVFAALAKARGE